MPYDASVRPQRVDNFRARIEPVIGRRDRFCERLTGCGPRTDEGAVGPFVHERPHAQIEALIWLVDERGDYVDQIRRAQEVSASDGPHNVPVGSRLSEAETPELDSSQRNLHPTDPDIPPLHVRIDGIGACGPMHETCFRVFQFAK